MLESKPGCLDKSIVANYEVSLEGFAADTVLLAACGGDFGFYKAFELNR